MYIKLGNMNVDKYTLVGALHGMQPDTKLMGRI
jgi:hypothetical protein